MVRAIRPPNAWAEAQRAFRLDYEADPDALPRQHVVVRWWVNAAPGGGSRLGFLAQILSRSWRGRMVAEGTYVAIYAPTARPPARPVVVFPVADASFEAPAGSGDAVVVGEVGLNGVCCVELPDGTVIWPIYNPVVPTGRSVPAP
jgi:hypothetical protein